MKCICAFFQRLFGGKKAETSGLPVPARDMHVAAPIPPMPSWEEIVEMMQNQPPRFRDKVTRVLYSADKTERFVILKSKKGHYTVRYEIVSAADEEEWEYIYTHNQLPGWWEESQQHWGVYATESAALADIQASYEYKTRFVQEDLL